MIKRREDKEYFMRVFIAALVSLVLLAPSALAQSELHVNVVINNTVNSVYIPGEGSVPSSGLPYMTYAPPKPFIASYSSGFVTALAESSGSVKTDGEAGSHTIGFVQPLGNSRVLLAFTEGDWETIDGRMGLIESGDFFRRITPSFAFGLGTEYVIRAILHYPNIDIEGGLEFSKGIYRLVIENKGSSGGKPLVEIRSV